MKKRYLVLAAGMALSLGLATGCAAKTTETEASTAEETVMDGSEEAVDGESEDVSGDAAESVSGEEANDASEGASGKAAESDGEDDNETGKEADTEGEDGLMASETLRIWGNIEAVEDGMITVDNQSGLSSPGEMIFTIDPEYTKILDAVSGYPVELEDIELGTFQAYLGPAMTMSLPPQTTPEMVIVNIPQDFHAPDYVTARGAVEETELGQTLMTVDGVAYVLTEETEVLPYLTKNIVTAQDINEGSKCLVWLNEEDGHVEKLVLFAE